MVGGTTQQHQQQAPPSSSKAPTTTPEEEEFLKRNKDCVYFLASPLTCKKGSECEYRHSDIARVNPRDCWYWLNGNCLNPKCGFRHPPLDGLLGADVPTPNGPSVPQSQTQITPASHATPYAMPKQGVACIFFQKGFCLKGHLCPFLHGPPNSVNYKAAQSGPANPVPEPPKMAIAGPEKSVQEQRFTQQANVQKPVEFLFTQGKQAPRSQAPPPARNGVGSAIEKNVPPPLSLGVEEPPRYKSSTVVPPSVVNEISASRSNRGSYQIHHVSDNDGILNGKDNDGYSREPSPGFDVLVDNELGDSEYYHNEEPFGRSRGHSYDIGRSTDYDVDRDMYRDQQGYDHYNERDRLQGGQYAWEDHRTDGAAQLERKRNPRNGSSDQFDESDLRHRISKQRRGNNNGLRSIVSREHGRDSHVDWMQRRDCHDHHQQHRLDQGPLGSRLRGRIKIPGRSTSPGSKDDLRLEREIDMGRQHLSRYSDQSRIRDNIKGRVSEQYNNEGRNYGGSHGPRDMVSDKDTEFTGPKRLSELKSGRTGEGLEQQMKDRQSQGKRKHLRLESQQSEDDLSFEGPKPLCEILKRKKGVETTAVDGHISSVSNEDKILKEIKDNEENNKKERTGILSGSTIYTKNEVSNSDSAENQTGWTNTDKDRSQDGQTCLNGNASELENEKDLIDEDAMLDQELEAYDHRDYEQIDGEDNNLDEGENPEEEYLYEEDGDDCAKEETVAYS